MLFLLRGLWRKYGIRLKILSIDFLGIPSPIWKGHVKNIFLVNKIYMSMVFFNVPTMGRSIIVAVSNSNVLDIKGSPCPTSTKSASHLKSKERMLKCMSWSWWMLPLMAWRYISVLIKIFRQTPAITITPAWAVMPPSSDLTLRGKTFSAFWR